MKKVLILLLCICVLFLFTSCEEETTPTPNVEYVITDYDVHAVISEANVYDITETIKVNFATAGHGIFRTIPIGYNTFQRGDKSTDVLTSVSDVRVDERNYTVSDNGWEENIKIGDADKTVIGDQTYKISYKLTFGDDGRKDFDEAYFNINGDDWKVPIEHFTFTVTLPKAFDKEKLGFSTGSTGSTGYDPKTFRFSVDGNTITGEVLRPLNNYEAVTMRLELPQDYFNLKIPEWIMMGVMGLLVFAGLMLFLIFGTDKKPLRIVEFYAPEGMTPAETGYIYDGSMDDRDVISLLLYWADKGYITIQKKDAGFQINMIKELGKDARSYERHMFEKLFQLGASVHTSELEYSFYKTISSVKTMVEAEYKNDANRIFTKISMKLSPYLTLLAALPIYMCWFIILQTASLGLGFTIPMMLVIGTALLLPAFWLIRLMRTWNSQRQKTRLAKLITALILFAGFMTCIVLLDLSVALEPLQPWCAIASSLILGLCAGFIRRRTPKGREWLGKILGLRDFIMVAEKDRILKLVEENLNYFYHILPYAYVLNVTDKWAEKFESIAIPPPDWYDGDMESFSPSLFATSISSSMSTMQSHMTSAPVSSSSGGSSGGGSGFSGGGSSGGGGGGGGGGAW